MIITLLTDFGSADHYVGEVKGVLLSLAPDAVLVDVAHGVPPGDVRAATFILSRVWRRFPVGTVHFVVVDPGVGTARRALAAEAAGHAFVAPDNGLLSSLPDDARVVELSVPADASPTFHGRDVFAAAAAQLVRGMAVLALGRPVADWYRSPLPAPKKVGQEWVGEVIYVDRFGTLITNIPGGSLEQGTRVSVGTKDVGPLRRTFAEVGPGTPVAFVGSGRTVEVAVRDGSAAHVLGVGVGVEIKAGSR